MAPSVGLFHMKSYTVRSCSIFLASQMLNFLILRFVGFDGTGHQFDSNGNLRNWWQNETTTNFQSKVQCFIDQVCRCHQLDGQM